MRRRAFLSRVGGVALGAAVTGRATGASRTDAPARICGAETPPSAVDHAAFAPLKAEPDFVLPATDRPDVRVHWQRPGWFADQGASFAVGISNIGGRDVALNTLHSREDWLHILLHELSHSLGYDHGDAGVASYGYGGAEDLDPAVGLAEPTVDVVTTFEGFRHCREWTLEDVGAVASDFARDVAGLRQVGHAATRYSEANPPDGCYFAEDFGDLGGEVDGGLMDGHFYGWPSLSRTP